MAEVTLSTITVEQASRPSAPGGATQRESASLSVAQARARATIAVAEPRYIPDGFDFDEASVVDGPAELTVLSYSAPSGDFLLVTAPLAQYRPGSDGKRRYLIVSDSIQEANVGGAPAALARLGGGPGEAVSLVWENGDRLNHLLGRGLSDGELERIAASVP